jgi:hypothetical protein
MSSFYKTYEYDAKVSCYGYHYREYNDRGFFLLGLEVRSPSAETPCNSITKCNTILFTQMCWLKKIRTNKGRTIHVIHIL